MEIKDVLAAMIKRCPKMRTNAIKDDTLFEVLTDSEDIDLKALSTKMTTFDGSEIKIAFEKKDNLGEPKELSVSILNKDESGGLKRVDKILVVFKNPEEGELSVTGSNFEFRHKFLEQSAKTGFVGGEEILSEIPTINILAKGYISGL